jgi:MFS family permease
MNADSSHLAPAVAAQREQEREREAAFRKQVDADLPRNYLAHLLHGIFAQTGFQLLQAPTFLPAYVFSLSGSTTLVGLARSCQALGMLATPVIGARLIEHRSRVIPMVFGTGAAMRLSVLAMALAGYYLGTQANLIAICVLMGLYGLFTGMQGVTFQFLVSKVIPVEKRGALGGARSAIAGLVASTVGVIGGYIVEHNWLGNGYATVLLVAFAMAAIGLLPVLIMREPESPGRPQQSLVSRLRELPALMRSDADYRAYTWARALGAGGRMGLPYYVLYASAVVTLPPGGLGWLTGAILVANRGSTLLWGLLADRRGFRNVLVLSLLVWIGATVVLMNATSFTLVLLGFVGLGVGIGGFEQACLNMVLEFGTREDLPMRIALSQTAEQVVNVIAPLAGGLIVATASYLPMFATAIAVQVAALALIVLRVREPRHRNRDQSAAKQ